MNVVIKMPRQPMNENDPLVPKQVSLPLSLKRKLKKAALASGKSESEIVRDALSRELKRTTAPSGRSQ